MSFQSLFQAAWVDASRGMKTATPTLQEPGCNSMHINGKCASMCGGALGTGAFGLALQEVMALGRSAVPAQLL